MDDQLYDFMGKLDWEGGDLEYVLTNWPELIPNDPTLKELADKLIFSHQQFKAYFNALCEANGVESPKATPNLLKTNDFLAGPQNFPLFSST